MTPLQQNIMRVLRQANALTAGEICLAVTANRKDVQPALHDLDEAGHVMMRNGFYRASEAARAQMACPAQPMTRPGEPEQYPFAPMSEEWRQSMDESPLKALGEEAVKRVAAEMNDLEGERHD